MDKPFVPFDPSVGFSQSRRRLPHREQSNCTYFATWRTADCVAQELLAQWRAERKRFLHDHPKPWNRETQRLYNDSFPKRLEEWSDRGLGACHLRTSIVRSIVVDALHFFQGLRYDLLSYVVMPNHVHVLLRPFDADTVGDAQGTSVNSSLPGILHSWKGFTGKRINEHLDLHGPFWMDETFDHAVRSTAQLAKLKQYIRDNPVKAGLTVDTYSVWEEE